MEGIPHALGYFTESGHVVGSTHNLDVYFFISISILNLNLNFMSNSTMIKRYCYFFPFFTFEGLLVGIIVQFPKKNQNKFIQHSQMC